MITVTLMAVMESKTIRLMAGISTMSGYQRQIILHQQQ